MQHSQLRQQFPLIHKSDLIYFDNAATTQKPEAVIQTLSQFYQTTNANVHRGAHQLSDKATSSFEQARKTVQQFINAKHWQEVIWTKGTTESINLVASSWGEANIKAGDSIIISTAEHHANIVPWQQLCAKTGAKLAVINLLESGELDLDHYAELLNDNPKLVAVTHISNVLGLTNPVKQLSEMAHNVGAKVLIDGAQSLAHESINVVDIDCDFFVASAHKAYGPTGIGFLYGKKELLEAMKPWQFGGEMISKVTFEETTFNLPPFRFEAGTPPIAEAIGFAAALTFLQQQSFTTIRQHEQKCLELLYKGLSDIPTITPLGQLENRCSLVAFNIDNTHPYDIGQLLNQHGIAIRAGHHCAMPLMDLLGLENGCARASLGIYNTSEEVEKFLNIIESICKTKTTSSSSKAENEALNNSKLYDEVKKLKSWQDKLNYLTKHVQNEQFLSLPEAVKTDDKLLHGCTSKVWLDHQYDAEANSLLFLVAADSKIIIGLAAVILSLVNGKSPAEVVSLNIDEAFEEVGLKQHLSPSRSNGVHTIATAIKTVAKIYAE